MIKELATASGSELVSIGLYVYNMERTVKRAIDSLLAQEYAHFELIISDNVSSDGTFEILQQAAAKDSRIRLIRQEKNIGGFANMKYVRSQARGEYFMWACADDFWEPGFIRRMLQELKENPDAGVVMSAFQNVNEENQPVKLMRFTGDADPTGLDPVATMRLVSATKRRVKQGKTRRRWLYKHNIYNLGLFRSNILASAIDYFPNSAHCDRIFFTLFALITPFRYVDEELFNRTVTKASLYERHKNESTGQWSRSDKIKVVANVIRLCVKLAADNLLPLKLKPYTLVAMYRLLLAIIALPVYEQKREDVCRSPHSSAKEIRKS